MSTRNSLNKIAIIGGQFMQRVRERMTYTGSPSVDFKALCKIVHDEYENSPQLQAAERALRKDFQ